MKSSVLRRWKAAVCIVVAASCLCGPAGALFARPPQTLPLERLVTNCERYVSTHPTDAQGYYVAGRLYSIAYARGTKEFGVFEPGDEKRLPRFVDAPGFAVRLQRSEGGSGGTYPLLSKAIEYYQKAVFRAPNNGLYWLGLGWMYEEGMRSAAEFGPPPLEGGNVESMSDADFARFSLLFDALAVEEERAEALAALAAETDAVLPLLHEKWRDQRGAPEAVLLEVVERAWAEKALDAYRRAHRLTYDKAKRSQYGGLELRVASESAQGLALILKKYESAELDRRELGRMEKRIKKLAAKPRVVTPIIFRLGNAEGPDDLLAPDKRVAFDLDGDGEARTWPWVRPGTGILVWDPKNTGKITSGRQLFGSVTWWVFWRNGYQAMASLDDTNDGWLTGDELCGLAVWHDKNGNGASDAGEVVPVGRLGIARLAVRAEGMKGGAPWHSGGVVLRDGRTFATYDWMPKSVE